MNMGTGPRRQTTAPLVAFVRMIRQPNWEDVEFDVAVARVAADACRQAATATGTAVELVTTSMGAIPEPDWTGATRSDLEREHGVVAGDGNATIDALSALAAELDAAADAAEDEQAARVADRERYRDEVAARNQDRRIPE